MSLEVTAARTSRIEQPTTTTSDVRTTAPSLLPAAGPLPSAGVAMGAMEQLYAAFSEMRDARMQQGQSQVKDSHLKSEVARKEREDAMKRAEEAAHKGGLVDWISKDIGLAGVVGLCTFNYALVAADIAAHKTHVVEDVKIDVVDVGAVATGRFDVLAADLLLRKTDLAPTEARRILEKCGIPKDAPGIGDEDVKPVARKVLVANVVIVSIAATALSGGTAAGITVALAGLALSAAGGEVAEKGTFDGVLGRGTSRWIGLGMQITGAVAASTAGMIPGKQVLAHGAALSGAVNGARTSVQGTDQVLAAVHAHEGELAKIDGEVWKQRLVELERFADRVIEGAKESTKSATRAEGAVRSAMETQLQTQSLLTAGIRA